MKYRFATDSDLDLLAEWNHQLIRDEGHRNPMTVPQLRCRMSGWLAGEYKAVIFSDGADPLAYALYKESETEIYLRQLFVRRDHRREGIGRKAIDILRTQIWPRSKRLTVEVLTANVSGVKFWRVVGYKDYSLALEIMPQTPGDKPSAGSDIGRRPLSVEVIAAGPDAKSVVMNLGLYYVYDFTDVLGFRCPEDGLFRTSQWENFWTEPGRWAFLVKVGGELAGFVLVGPDGTQPDSEYDVAEFFIMRKFRGQGVGQQVAFDIFNRFRGRWEVRVVIQNEPALAFWRKVVSRYTAGRYQELPEPVRCGEWQDQVLTFDNADGR